MWGWRTFKTNCHHLVLLQVIKNLHIANLELRTEECIDVARYSHVRKINTVVVHLGTELTRLRDQYVEVLDTSNSNYKAFGKLKSQISGYLT